MKKTIIALLLIFTFFQFGAFAQNQEDQGVERYALYIASNLGGEDRATLRYAGSDAEKLSETMIELGGIKKQNSFILIDSTKAEIDGAFQNITAIINNSKTEAKRVEFLFYYSGHSDENALLLGEESYDYSELKAKISSIPSDVHVVVLDSCFSGNFIRAKGGSRQKSFLVDDSSVVKGHAYLSSSSETESSQESDDIEASYFTQALITGLRGAADTSGDNRVSLNELYYYAFNETLKQTETSTIGTQHPSFDITLVGSGDLVLTDISTAESVLVLPAEAQGRFLVRTLEGNLAAEINKQNGTVMSLALPAGFYSVTMLGEKSTTQAQVKLAKNQVYTLETKGHTQLSLTAGTGKGSENAESTNRPTNTESANRPSTETEKETGTSPKYLTDEEIDAILYGTGSSNKTETNTNSSTVKTDKSENNSLPVINIDYTKCGNRTANFVLSVIPGITFPANGEDAKIVVSPFISLQHCVEGLQINGLIGITKNSLQGIQASGLVNISNGLFQGIQFSGLVNILNGNMQGVQNAGLVNIAREKIQGVQNAGLINISQGKMQGVQSAGLANISKGKIQGVQVAGLINIAEEVQGLQVGLINIAERNQGISFGLINIIKNGIFDPAIYYANDEMFIQYQGGTNYFYTTFIGGTKQNFNFNYGVFGMGIGTRLGKDFLCLDLELIKYQVFSNGLKKDIESLGIKESSIEDLSDVMKKYSYPSFRATLNFRFGNDFGLFIAYNADFETCGSNEKAFENRSSGKLIKAPFGIDSLKAHTYWSFGLKF